MMDENRADYTMLRRAWQMNAGGYPESPPGTGFRASWEILVFIQNHPRGRWLRAWGIAPGDSAFELLGLCPASWPGRTPGAPRTAQTARPPLLFTHLLYAGFSGIMARYVSGHRGGLACFHDVLI